jgi:hypothetical protein
MVPTMKKVAVLHQHLLMKRRTIKVVLWGIPRLV